jgi:hypothetical protein
MWIEMIVAEMRDREALMEYETLFIHEIGPTLAALPGVESAYIAAKKRTLVVVVTVVWTTGQIAAEWRRHHGHSALVDTLTPYVQGKISSGFFGLGERGNLERHLLN